MYFHCTRTCIRVEEAVSVSVKRIACASLKKHMVFPSQIHCRVSVFVSFLSACIHHRSICYVYFCVYLTVDTRLHYVGLGTLITSMATISVATFLPSYNPARLVRAITRLYFSIDYLSCNYPTDRTVEINLRVDCCYLFLLRDKEIMKFMRFIISWFKCNIN